MNPIYALFLCFPLIGSPGGENCVIHGYSDPYTPFRVTYYKSLSGCKEDARLLRGGSIKAVCATKKADWELVDPSEPADRLAPGGALKTHGR